MKKAFLPVLAVFLLFSCSRSVNLPEEPAADPVPEPVSQVRDSRIAEIEKSILESRNSTDGRQEKKISGESYGSRRFLMAETGNPVYPSDFVIGKTAEEIPAEGSPEQILTDFFRYYGSKELRQKSEQLFTDRSRIMLTVLFEEWADEGHIPTALRFGESYMKDENTVIAVRCFRDKSSCACEFTLTKEEGSWKIGSFSGNLADLALPHTEPEELFEPEVYYFF